MSAKRFADSRDQHGLARGRSGPVTARGRIVVLDENEATRRFICDALDGGGYDTVGVATTIGLRKALVQTCPALVVCDVSPPLSFDQAVAGVRWAQSVVGGRAPVAVCGCQPANQLSRLAQASGAPGYIERGEDPRALLREVQHLVGVPGSTLPPDPTDGVRPRSDRQGWAVIRLLLIDDSEVALGLLQDRLRQSGFDVRIALSLGEVRSIIHGWSPNVIVADVNMPEIRGDDLCARLKAAAATRDAVVVLWSSLPDRELRVVAEASGADEFVSKVEGLDRCASVIEAACWRISSAIVSFC